MWDIFSSESDENLLTIEQALLSVEKTSQDRENVDLIYRALHTFKGNVRVMGLTVLENLACLAEDLMGLVRDHGLPIDQGISDVLLQAVDNFRIFISEVKESQTDIDIEKTKQLTDKLMIILKKSEEKILISSINDEKPIYSEEFPDSVKTNPPEDQMYLMIYFDMLETDLPQLSNAIEAFMSGSNDAIQIIHDILQGWLHATERMKFNELLAEIEKMLNALNNNETNNLQSLLTEFIILLSLTKKNYINSEVPSFTEEIFQTEDPDITLITEKNSYQESMESDSEFLEIIQKNLEKFSNEFALLKQGNNDYLENVLETISEMIEFSQKKGFIRLIDILDKIFTEISINENIQDLEIEHLEYELFRELSSLEQLNETDSNTNLNSIFRHWHAERVFTHIIKIKKNIDALSELINKKESARTIYLQIKEISRLLHFIHYSCLFYGLDKMAEFALSIKDIYLRSSNEDIPINPLLPELTNTYIDLVSKSIESSGIENNDYAVLYELLDKINNKVNNLAENEQILAEYFSKINNSAEFKEVMTAENLELLAECLNNNFSTYIIEVDLEKDENESLFFYNWLQSEKIITSITRYIEDRSLFQFIIASIKPYPQIKKELSQILLNIPYKLISGIPEEKVENTPVISSLNNFMVDKTYLRINSNKINQLMDLVGEISLVTGAILAHPEVKNLKSLDFEVLTKNLESLMSELQGETSNLGLVPVEEVFKRMQRLVRDLGKETGKNVSLQLFGEDTEIDKAMVEKIYEPLLHILRNAVDHGLEHPAERIKLGKNPVGTIKLKAYNQSSEIIISVEDDGRGLERQKILEKAIELNLLDKDNIPNDKTIFNCIFHPGFSTAEKLSSISGRGVGMDVVKHSISELRGKISIESKENKGTVIQLHLPLTLAFIEGMIVRVNEKLYAIPITSISEVFKLEEKTINNISANKSQLINIRNNLIPTCWLQNFYNENRLVENHEDKIIVVVNSSKGNLAIPVDQLLGNQLLTQKPLTSYLKDIRAGAGYGLLSSGEVAIILDCEKLYAG